MANGDEDLRTLFRTVAEAAHDRPGAEGKLLVAARRRRLMAAGLATLSALVLIGGIAAASIFWQPRETTPAPPAYADCRVTYDVAVFIEDSATEEQIEKLRADLLRDEEADRVVFMSRAAAFEEFKEHYEDQPEFWENLPEDALPMSFRVSLVDGSDATEAARRFRTLPSVEAVRTADQLSAGQGPPRVPDCPSESEETFARFFFEAAKQEMSVSGVLEVNTEKDTLCLQATLSDNIKASHLLWRRKGAVDEGPRVQEVIAATFFDPDDAQAPSSPASTICLRREQLGELRGEFEGEHLQALIDHPEQFRIDFHRGPNDDPGLVAALGKSFSRRERASLQRTGGRTSSSSASN